MICVIDNYDSFVYNLVQYIGELGEEVQVYRNDQISIAGIQKVNPSAIVLSPGPCTPHEAGICMKLTVSLAGKFPILGICLGHQVIAAAFGGVVERLNTVVHGKASEIYHTGKSVFQGMKNPFHATRYHSLAVNTDNLPECFEISSWTKDGIIMGISHKRYHLEGLQFHPESILTENGKRLLKNFLNGL
jgi:anthranilate synthase/aminodeoxychorismate synthase-like glutamine amidotransferase